MYKSHYCQKILFFFLLFSVNSAFATLDKKLWPQWEVHNPLSQSIISHAKWQQFLNARVITNNEGINLVDYAHLTKADKMLLHDYINDMSQINLNNYNRAEQLAFWINLYNAVTVKTIAHYYPVSSIEDINISPGLFSIGPWGAKLITVNGVAISLDDIHNRIIRPIWNDPRTHYVINNGSIGAANLNKYAYRGAILESQLNTMAKNYINSLRGVQIIEGKLILSKIYEWFMNDFGGTDEYVITHLKQFAHPSLLESLEHITTIDNYVYNWHLNGAVDAIRDENP